MTEVHLCRACAEERGLVGVPATPKFSIADLLATMVDKMSTTEEERVGPVQCPTCGMHYSAFKETGRLGCADCYVAFQSKLRPLLRRIHGSTAPRRQASGPRRGRPVARPRPVAPARRPAARRRARGFRERSRDPRSHQRTREAAGRGGARPAGGMMDLETLARTPGPWLDGSGPRSDLVVSTRVRLARNLAGVPFSHRARDEQLVGVLGAVERAAAGRRRRSQGGGLLRMHELTPIDRQFLVERHLVSHELSDGARPRGLVRELERAPVGDGQRGGSRPAAGARARASSWPRRGPPPSTPTRSWSARSSTRSPTSWAT